MRLCKRESPSKFKFAKGNICYGNRKYKTLLLIEVESMQPETAKALHCFAKSGGKIICIGKEPKQSAGFLNHEKRDAQVAEIVNAIKQNFRESLHLFPAPEKEERKIDWYRKMQRQFGITPYLKLDNPCPWVNQVYYQHGDTDIIFFSNYSLKRSFKNMAKFMVTGKTAWLWDVTTGERYLYPVEKDGQTISISLEPGESKVIVYDKNVKGETYSQVEPEETNAVVVAGPWKLTLEHVKDTTQKTILDELVDFKDNEFLKSFAGIATYENTFSVGKATKPTYIDLGKVQGVSELIINGKNAGVRWYGRHLFDVSAIVQVGENSIKIKITTTLGNYMKSLTDKKLSQRWMKTQSLYSIGLIGPVKVI